MEVDTSIIATGQEFKNLQELSTTLTGERIPKGSGYAPRVNLLQKYISWEPIEGTRKVIITEIYDTPKILSVRGTYTPQLLSNLYTLELGKKYTIYDLYLLLGITSERFVKPKFFVENMNNAKLSAPAYSVLHAQIELILTQMIYRILCKQSNNKHFSYYSTYVYEFKEGFPVIDIPDEYLDDVKSQALLETNYDSEWSALHSRDSKRYKKFIMDHLAPFNVKKYKRAYIFTEFNPPMYLPAPSNQALNDLVVQKLKLHYQKVIDITPGYLQQINTLIDYTVAGRWVEP